MSMPAAQDSPQLDANLNRRGDHAYSGTIAAVRASAAAGTITEDFNLHKIVQHPSYEVRKEVYKHWPVVGKAFWKDFGNAHIGSEDELIRRLLVSKLPNGVPLNSGEMRRGGVTRYVDASEYAQNSSWGREAMVNIMQHAIRTGDRSLLVQHVASNYSAETDDDYLALAEINPTYSLLTQYLKRRDINQGVMMFIADRVIETREMDKRSFHPVEARWLFEQPCELQESDILRLGRYIKFEPFHGSNTDVSWFKLLHAGLLNMKSPPFKVQDFDYEGSVELFVNSVMTPSKAAYVTYAASHLDSERSKFVIEHLSGMQLSQELVAKALNGKVMYAILHHPGRTLTENEFRSLKFTGCVENGCTSSCALMRFSMKEREQLHARNYETLKLIENSLEDGSLQFKPFSTVGGCMPISPIEYKHYQKWVDEHGVDALTISQRHSFREAEAIYG